MGEQEGGRAQEPCRLRPRAFTARPHPLGPKNLRTGNGKLARSQRRLCQTICKIYPARTLVALLWVVAHRHHPRLVGGDGAQWDSLTATLQ